jgi:hypothetical protein
MFSCYNFEILNNLIFEHSWNRDNIQGDSPVPISIGTGPEHNVQSRQWAVGLAACCVPACLGQVRVLQSWIGHQGKTETKIGNDNDRRGYRDSSSRSVALDKWGSPYKDRVEITHRRPTCLSVPRALPIVPAKVLILQPQH